jgi:hypothetical protein
MKGTVTMKNGGRLICGVGMEPRALYMIDKYSTTWLHPSSKSIHFKVDFTLISIYSMFLSIYNVSDYSKDTKLCS